MINAKKIRDFIEHDFKNGVKNLIKWFPIIWKDRQWDYYFIYAILNYKLKLVEHFTRHHGNHLHRKRDANQIKACITILDRLTKDDYFEIASAEFYKKWGEATISHTELDNSELHIEYPNAKTDEEKEKVHNEFRTVMDIERELKNKDQDMLFSLLRKHIEGWWD